MAELMYEYTCANNGVVIYNNLSCHFSRVADDTTIAHKRIMGDVDGDLSVGVSDIIMLQKWLLAVPGAELTKPEGAYLNDDNVIDIFDLALLKRMVLNA